MRNAIRLQAAQQRQFTFFPRAADSRRIAVAHLSAIFGEATVTVQDGAHDQPPYFDAPLEAVAPHGLSIALRANGGGETIVTLAAKEMGFQGAFWLELIQDAPPPGALFEEIVHIHE